MHGGRRRRALCAAGRHHQPERIPAGQLDRSGDLGGGRRPRHAHRCGSRRARRQLRPDLFHLRHAGAVLAVHARRAVRRGDAVPAARHHRHAEIWPRSACRALGRGRRWRRDQHHAAGDGAARGGVGTMDAKTTSALLYLDGISVSFDGFKALNSLSFAVEPGEMRAIIGPNGAGKTTMMDVVTGKTRPDTGDVYFQQGGYDLSKLDETEIAELGIGRKFQKPTVFEMHTVEDNLLLALKADRRVRGTLVWETSAPQEARISELLDIIRLKG